MENWIPNFVCFSCSGFVNRAARESPYSNRLPQGGRLRLRHLPVSSHGALAVPATAAWLGSCKPEPGLWAFAHRHLHAHRCHALRARQLPLLPHGDPVWEARRCSEVRFVYKNWWRIYAMEQLKKRNNNTNSPIFKQSEIKFFNY